MSVSPETPKAENKTVGAKPGRTLKGGGARSPVRHMLRLCSWEALARPPPPGPEHAGRFPSPQAGEGGVLPLHLMPDEGGTSRGPFGELDTCCGV